MIRFGTSGWRAVISDGFTFENVRRVTRAIAMHLKEQGIADRGVAVGMDTRFLAEEFAAEVARTLISEAVPARLATGFLPTPALAFAIQDGGLAGGINVTASHNPPEYSGLKFSTADGAPAPAEVTARIEEGIGRVSGEAVAGEVPAPAPLDPKERYFERLRDLVDTAALRRLQGPIAFDARYGTTRGWLDAFLEDAGVEVIRLHDHRDPLFGGGTPDCGGQNLADLRDVVVSRGCALGLATDGDGDRFAIVDPCGEVVIPNLVLALLADDLLTRRGWSGGIGRTVATTHLLDRVAILHGRRVHETAVGFKHFNPLLAAGRIFMGAEESAGFSVRGHVPEKDGMLACLLVVEMTAVAGKGPLVMAEDLYRRVGRVVSRRRDLRFDPGRRAELAARTRQAPERLAGGRVERTVSLDGDKWIREDGAWLLVRMSGTEPLVRVYAEAGSEREVEALLAAGEALLV